MSAYEKPEKDLAIFDPSVFTSNDEPLTINTGSKYFLRFPYAQNTENFNALSANTITSAANLLLNPTGTINTNGKTIDASGGQIQNVSIVNSVNNADITLEGRGTGDVILKTASTNAFVITDAGAINVEYPLSMTSATSTRRAINTSALNINEATGVYNSAVLNQIYSVGGTAVYNNLINSGSHQFQNKDSGGTVVNTMVLNTTSATFARPMIINANQNLTMNAGTGKINQIATVGDVTTMNNLKRTEIVINSNSPTGSSTAGLEVYDAINGKGLYILPNCTTGSLSNINQTNDCAVTSRATQNSNAITLTNWNSDLRNGVRVATTDVSNCSVSIQCGQNSTNDWTAFNMNYTRTGGANTTTTTFNNVINFNPGGNLTPLRRQLIGLGTLNFTDILGNTTAGTAQSLIYMDSSTTVPGTFYDCSLNSGSHNFVVNDNSGNKKTPVFFGSALTSVLNTLSVRNETTTSNRFDILTDSANNTNIRARSSTASTNALININCDTVTAGGASLNNAVMTIAPLYMEMKRPIQFNYITRPSSSIQLGYIENYLLPQITVPTSASVRNIGTFTIANPGTYNIEVIFGISGSASFTLTDCLFGCDNVISELSTILIPTKYTQSLIGNSNITINTTSICYLKSNFNINFVGSANVMYVNYKIQFSGGANAIITTLCNSTRIG